MASLLVPIVAGAFVVLGALIGALLARSSEHRQWLRNEKIKAYQKFVDTFAGAPLTNGLNIIGYDAREASEVIGAYEEMYRVCLAVQFVAPVAIANEVDRTSKALGDLQGWINELPQVMHKKHLQSDMTGQESEEASVAMSKNIADQLQSKLGDFASESIDRVNTAVEMMRKDLRIRDRAFL